MARIFFICIFIFWVATICFAQEQVLLLDDFAGEISGGPSGTVDFGAGNGSSVEVTAASDIKHSGSQSLKIVYNAVPGGYMWIARGYGLDAQNSRWLLKPEEIKWEQYKAIAFYLYGSNSKTKVAFDIKDSGNEIWRFLFEDNFTGWKKITCLFQEFFCRGDWQPDAADKNATLNFPIKSFQLEPLPEAKGTLYLADVQLE